MSLPCVLIDFENVQPKALGRLVPGTTRIKVFLGQHQTKVLLDLVKALQPFGADAEYIQIQGTGPDAVDFHIAFYIGEIGAHAPDTRFQIISKDRGFDPLVKHLVGRGFDVVRLPEIPEPVAVAPKPALTPKPAAKRKPTAKPKPVVKPKPSAPTTTKARAKVAVARLKISSRPTTIVKLRSSLMSWFKDEWGEKSVDAILQSLQASKVVVVAGTKVTYNLG
jgi:hypothetical protein